MAHAIALLSGASFNIGEQNGFTLDLGAQTAKNLGSGGSVTQVNTTLDSGSLVNAQRPGHQPDRGTGTG